MAEPRVRIVTGHEGYPPHVPVVLVDGEPLRGVTKVELAPYQHGEDAWLQATLTVLGVDVALDVEAEVPEHLVRVVGPRRASDLTPDEARALLARAEGSQTVARVPHYRDLLEAAEAKLRARIEAGRG